VIKLRSASIGFLNGGSSSLVSRPEWKSIFTLVMVCALITPAFAAVMTTNIEYGVAGTNHLFLDASVPEGTGPFPVGIVVHGGGWCAGDKEHDVEPMEIPLTAAKFTWFSIDYRLGPTNLWPACFEDVQTAIRWVKAHAAEYKGDSNHIALCGYSAGGHLVCLAATQAKADTRVQAILGYAPPTDMVADNVRRNDLSKSLQMLLDLPPDLTDQTRQTLAAMSPIEFVKPGLPPFLLIQGDSDKTVLYAQTVNFQARLLSDGNTCDLITITNAQHRIMDWKKYNDSFEDQIKDWLVKTVGKK
jgi:acetyl esterase/lipase